MSLVCMVSNSIGLTQHISPFVPRETEARWCCHLCQAVSLNGRSKNYAFTYWAELPAHGTSQGIGQQSARLSKETPPGCQRQWKKSVYYRSWASLIPTPSSVPCFTFSILDNGWDFWGTVIPRSHLYSSGNHQNIPILYCTLQWCYRYALNFIQWSAEQMGLIRNISA